MATTEDVTLRVIADIRDYQKKFSELPGITEKQALSLAIKERRIRVSEEARTAKLIAQEARRAAREAERADFDAAKRRSASIREVQAAYERATGALEAQKRAQMSASQQAVADLNKEIAALQRLEKEGADATQVAKARQAVQMAGAQKIAAARASDLARATAKAADATGDLAIKSTELKNAGRSLAQQLPDVISQLASGTPVMQVVAQQGLQVVQMNMGLLIKAGRILATVFSGPVIVALAAAAAGLALLYARVEEQRAAQASLEKALLRTNTAMDPKLVRMYADAQKVMASTVEESRVALLQEAGVLDSLEISQMRAVEATRQQGRAALMAARAQYVKLEVDRIQIKTALESGELTFKQTEAAQKRLAVLREEVPIALQNVAVIQEQIDEQAAQVNEYYNQIAAIKAQRDAERDAESARSSAAKSRSKDSKQSARDAADEAREREALAEALRQEELARQSAFSAALQAARQPFIKEDEITKLVNLKVALIDTAMAAELTSGEALAVQESIARINQEIQVLQAAGPTAVAALGAELSTIGPEALAAADEMATAIEDSAGRMRLALIGVGIKETLKSAGRLADMLTGGGLSSIFNPSEIIGQIGEAASPRKARKLAKNMADQAIAFVDNLAKNIGPFINAIVDKIPDIIVALAKAVPKIIAEIIKALPQIVKAVWTGVAKGAVALAKSIARQVRNAVRGAFGLEGRRDRRRVGDTPGPMRMPRGGTVEVAPNDVVVAGRTEQAVRDQMGASMSRSGPTEVVTVIDIRDGAFRLGMSRATQRELDRRGVGRDTTGRRRVY